MRSHIALAAALFLYAAPACADITTGENAIDELGQFASTTSDTTLKWTQANANNDAGSVNALGIDESDPTNSDAPNPGNTAIDIVNHRLFVSDTYNNRVLVYTLNTDNSISTASGGHTAQYVLGQTSLTSTTMSGVDGACAAAGQSTLCQPEDLAFDAANNRLFVADDANVRVLVFNTSTITDGMNASYVIGCGDFVGDGCGGNQSGFTDPQGLAYDAANKRLFVADSSDDRVMVFNVAPGFANGPNAENVLGQSSYTANVTGHTASKMNAPWGLAYDPINTRLFVADQNNNRVTVFNVNTSTISNGESASYALGASNLTSVGSGQCTQSTFVFPNGVAYDPNNHGTLFVATVNNDEVLVFNASPAYISNGENASYVLGQPNFTTCAGNTTQSGLSYPIFINYDPASSRLFVVDDNNNRVMIFDGGVAPAGWTPGYD